MVRAHDRSHAIERSNRSTQVVPDNRVLSHQRMLVRIETAFLEQHVVRDRDLAKVVKYRAGAQRVEIAARQTKFRPERSRICREPLAVPFRVRIARLDDVPEHRHDGFGRLEIVGETFDAKE